MNALKNPLALMGRVLLGVFLIPAGVGKIAGFAGTVGYTTATGLPLQKVGVPIVMVVEIVGGLALLVGFQSRFAALALGSSPWWTSTSFMLTGPCPQTSR